MPSTDYGSDGKTVNRLMFARVVEHLPDIEPLGVVDAALRVGDCHDRRTRSCQQVG